MPKAPITANEKLQKVLARYGLGSRREIERWIAAGRVTVNGQIAQLGDRIDATAQLAVDGKSLVPTAKTAGQASVLLYHKRVGEMCTASDPEGRPTVFDQLPSPPSGRWVMVGRLDYNTSGLLLFTNDGELAHKLMHPSSNHPRVYAARLSGILTKDMLLNLRQGVILSDGIANFNSIEPMPGAGVNRWYKVSLTMGRNRIVRRLFESQGMQVNRLVRLSFGTIMLPKTLVAGKYKLLSAAEVRLAMH